MTSIMANYATTVTPNVPTADAPAAPTGVETPESAAPSIPGSDSDAFANQAGQSEETGRSGSSFLGDENTASENLARTRDNTEVTDAGNASFDDLLSSSSSAMTGDAEAIGTSGGDEVDDPAPTSSGGGIDAADDVAEAGIILEVDEPYNESHGDMDYWETEYTNAAGEDLPPVEEINGEENITAAMEDIGSSIVDLQALISELMQEKQREAAFQRECATYLEAIRTEMAELQPQIEEYQDKLTDCAIAMACVPFCAGIIGACMAKYKSVLDRLEKKMEALEKAKAETEAKVEASKEKCKNIDKLIKKTQAKIKTKQAKKQKLAEKLADTRREEAQRQREENGQSPNNGYGPPPANNGSGSGQSDSPTFVY